MVSLKQLQEKGIYWISEDNSHYDKAEEHLSKANDSESNGDMEAFHHHMSNHHDSLSEWHDSKGRSASADKHADKAEYHHDKAIEASRSVKEAVKIGSKVTMHSPGKDYHGQVGHVGEIRNGAYKGADKTYTVDYDNGKSVQLGKNKVKLHKEETRSVAERIVVAKEIYNNKMKSANTPDARAQAKEDYDHFVKSIKEQVELEEAISESAPFKKLEHAVAYATDKVKTHRDNLDGIEVYKHKSGGYDVNHTMNANGRKVMNTIGAKHLGTVYKDKPANIKEETIEQRKDREKQLKNFKQFTQQMDEQAPVAPVPDRKYIKGTPEHKAHMATKKPINGMPTNVKEELELQENHREFAQHGKMHPDMAKHMSVGKSMDYYHPNNGDKVSGKVIKKTDKEVHMKSDHNGKEAAGPVHIFHIASKIEEGVKRTATGLVHTKDDYEGNPSTFKDKEQTKLGSSSERSRMNKVIPPNKTVDESNDVPFDGPYVKSKPVKNSDGTIQSPMSRARELAQNAIAASRIEQRAKEMMKAKKQVKEAKDEQEYGYEGDMALNQLSTLTRCAEMIKDMLKPETDLPEWVQSKITLATDYIQTAADYLYSEMNEELKGKQHKIDKNKNGKIDGQDFKLLRKESLTTPLGKKVPTDGKSPVSVKVNAAGQKPEEESGKPSKVKEQLSYKDFLAALAEGSVMKTPTGIIHKGNRGYGNEPHHDDPDRDSYAKDDEKRGRGRPVGSKAGPRKITGTSKLYK